MKTVFALLLFSFSVHFACAQRELLMRADSFLTARYRNAKVDTAYISRPAGKWILKVRTNVSGSEIEAKTVADGISYKTKLQSDYRMTLSLGASYNGFSVALSINPAHLTGKNNDFELNLNSYGNRIGGDIVYQSSKTFSGTLDVDDKTNHIARGLVSQKILVSNVYYVFNNRRFSLPAALSQSYIQKRSAGSFMLGLSFWGGEISYPGDEAAEIPSLDINHLYVGLGGGYGYNLAVSDRWLFHLSGLPTFIVYGRRKVRMNDNSEKSNYSFPEVIITGRGAVVYRFGRCFAGFSMNSNFLNIGSSQKLYMSNSKFRGRAFFGITL